jgi:dipeptidyl aminopeptidase/acylaminoacyl peptidase
MRIVSVARVCALASAALLVTIGIAAANPPPEAFGTLPQFDGWKMSPDGKHIAVLQSNQGHSSIFVYEVGAAPGAKPLAIPVETNVPRLLQWVRNDRFVVYLTTNYQTNMDRVARSWARIISISVDGQHSSQLSGVISQMNLDDPETAYSVMDGSVYRIGVDHMTDPRIIESGGVNTVQWIIDGHGDRIARIDQADRDANDLDVLSDASGSWRTIGRLSNSYQQLLSIDGAMPDDHALAITRYGSGDKRTIEQFDLATGKTTQLFSAGMYDVDSAIENEWTGKVIGASYLTDRRQSHYFDPGLASLQAGLETALPNLSVSILSTNMAGDRALVEADGPKQPPVYLYYDRATKQASVVGNAYPMLTAADLGDQKPYVYTARDGLEIHGYLTLPPGVTDPKNLPMVVFPHGGPEARDAIGFDWLGQFMANRGYAVFQPNFRGSTGYGSAFLRAGDGQWGHKMLDDITDGTKKLIVDGIADPKRICIVGASYGGYAALAQATFTPDLYACAVSYAGVFNVQSIFEFDMRATNDNRNIEALERRRFGTSMSDTSALSAVSPAFHANQVKAPVLLVHSLKDVTVPASQTTEECRALERAGKQVQCIAIEGDDHYLSRSTTRIQLLKLTEQFLAKYLK